MSHSQDYIYECRLCKRITEQIERIVVDTLPPSVKTLECTKCGSMSVGLIGITIDEVKL